MGIREQYPDIKPSLNLDFANTKKLDPRITFTRTTTARYYDGRSTAKAEENLVLRSQEFDVSPWSVANATVSANTGDTTAPDGTSTAEKLIENANTSQHLVRQAVIISLVPHTISFFAKQAERTWVQFGVSSLVSSVATSFDLANGVVGTVGPAASNASIVSVGNGWYRCSLTFTPTATNGQLEIRLASADHVSSYAGDGTSGIYLWGAQLEQRSSVTAYTPTTTQPITNYIPVLQTAAAGEARFDHNPVTGESLGLLIEEQRSNLLLRSEDLDTTWSETRATLGLNSVVAPDGTLTADRLIDTTDNDTHFTTQTFTGTAASHTFSVYAKASGLNHVALRLFNGTSQVGLAYYNLSTGATGTVTAGTASIQSVGNGWYRCVLTATLAASASCTADIYLANADNTNSFAGNAFNGVALWGMQVEAGAFSTSYIKTEGSTVTRNADAASMTGANFSSWYRADEGTLFADYLISSTSGTGRPFHIGDATVNNQIGLYIQSGNNKCFVNTNNVTQADLTSGAVVADAPFKSSLAYRVNNIALSGNGLSPTTDTSATIPTVTAAYIGQTGIGSILQILNGTIRKIAYYPARLSNAELQALTTV